MSDKFVLELDRYERDNLLALLHLIYQTKDGPPLANGDWAGQIYWKLAPEGFDPTRHFPNIHPNDQLRMLDWWRKP